MNLRIRETSLHLMNLRTRIPFRYGIAVLTGAPHLFLRVQLELNGTQHAGLAADNLPPKWFTKNPETSFEQDVQEMLEVIRQACALAESASPCDTPFDLWRHIYDGVMRWGKEKRLPPLLCGFGASMVERAMIDAFCRATGSTFARALRENSLGVRLADLNAELAGSSPRQFLPDQPLRTILVRHTVGLTDPSTGADIAPEERVDDGLPQSLDECVRAYGLTRFKIKLCGDATKDIPRLRQIGQVLHRECGEDFAFTLDGNEQFRSVEGFRELWDVLTDDPALRNLLEKLIFVEQPLHRAVALGEEALSSLRRWSGRPRMIIDESDGTLGSLPAALGGGYVGTSHKNCKGIFKGIANASLIAHRRLADPQGTFVLSGEDLTTVGPVSLLQDLAVSAGFGITHIERNGHHYFRGLGMFPREIQEATLRSHADLYSRHDRGFPTLRIERGRLELGSVVDAPFGYSSQVDLNTLTPLANWRFDS